MNLSLSEIGTLRAFYFAQDGRKVAIPIEFSNDARIDFELPRKSENVIQTQTEGNFRTKDNSAN